MAPPTRKSFPPVRAVIFDVDGLLIDSEDKYTKVTNTILAEHNKPALPWSIKAQLQGRPGPQAGKIFRDWAQLPISEEEFMKRQRELQALEFPHCAPLPGVTDLLRNLSRATTTTATVTGSSSASSSTITTSNQQQQRQKGGNKVRMAVATSSHKTNYEIKTQHMKKMFGVFPDRQIIVGDDVRVPRGRGKPLPDIYLLALQVLNTEMESEEQQHQGKEEVEGEPTAKEPPILPEECLVFEDSVPGVEAGRRAGMRVVWCPHPGLLDVYSDRVDEVLAGRTGEHKESDLAQHQDSIPLAGSPGLVGELQDGWAERLTTLEEFDYGKYGIQVNADVEPLPGSGASSTPDTTTDKALEEMTALADGKSHAKEEGTHSGSPVPGLSELNAKV